MKNPCTAHLSLPISHRSPSDNIYSPPSLSPCSTIRVEIFLPSGYSSALQPCSLTLPVGCTPACLSLKREIDGEQRGRRRGRRGRGVAQGGRAEGHGGGPGPACQGGGQHDAAEVPARARPRRGQGLGDAAQVRGVEAGGRAGRRRRRDAGRSGADGAVAGQGPHGRRRPRRPPRPARLPRQALVRRPRHGGAQATCRVPAGQDQCQDPAGAGQVHVHRGPQGVGVPQLRRARLHRRHRDHAGLLPGAAGQGAHGPRALHLHEGLEDGLPLHRHQHQGQVRVRGRQELGGDSAAGDGREPGAGDVRREAAHCPPHRRLASYNVRSIHVPSTETNNGLL
uniref:Uncharacterized protein n=1 Tax=Triticum urartu TaxID=4572 RepID=A0A8R7U194_TRIUA